MLPKNIFRLGNSTQTFFRLENLTQKDLLKLQKSTQKYFLGLKTRPQNIFRFENLTKKNIF